MASCLVLVVACTIGAFYLNRLHRGVSVVLAENVASTVADKELETTLDEMVPLLRGDHSHPKLLTAELLRRQDKANQQLENVEGFANTDAETELVNQVAHSWSRYKERWTKRSEQPVARLTEFDGRLAHQLIEDVLPRCSHLLEYNTRQVSEVDHTHQRIVDRLTWGLLAVGVGAPLAGLLLGYAVARRLHQSIYQLSVRIRDAAGRLNSELRPLTLESDGDLTSLNRQMQAIIDEIERVFQRLHQREREVLRAEQLAAVGQVAAGVAHELRNPLTSVKMLVQTGLEGAPPSGLPAEDLAIIEHEVRRMEACIQTFLDFARPPSSERRRTDLLEVVRRAVALMEGRARRQNILIKTALPSGPVEVLIDRASKSSKCWSICCSTPWMRCRKAARFGSTCASIGDPSRAVVRIHDTGPGIAAPILARLFEPFVSGKETGLGLGLSISQRLVEANGGSITGENAPEGGAIFTFTLPG